MNSNYKLCFLVGSSKPHQTLSFQLRHFASALHMHVPGIYQRNEWEEFGDPLSGSFHSRTTPFSNCCCPGLNLILSWAKKVAALLPATPLTPCGMGCKCAWEKARAGKIWGTGGGSSSLLPCPSSLNTSPLCNTAFVPFLRVHPTKARISRRSYLRCPKLQIQKHNPKNSRKGESTACNFSLHTGTFHPNPLAAAHAPVLSVLFCPSGKILIIVNRSLTVFRCLSLQVWNSYKGFPILL